MNLVTFHIDDFPTIGATELDVSSGGSSSVDETSGGTTTQIWIVYNGNSNTPYAEFNGSGTLLERYLAGPSYVPGVTGMIARTNASGVTDWYSTGKLGSVRDIVDTSGTVIDHISYGAFGSIRAETNPSSGSRFKFDGMQYDTSMGLFNDWHRDYATPAGRFRQEDPIPFNGNLSNLYDFTSISPSNTLDINGYDEYAGKTLFANMIWYREKIVAHTIYYIEYESRCVQLYFPVFVVGPIFRGVRYSPILIPVQKQSTVTETVWEEFAKIVAQIGNQIETDTDPETAKLSVGVRYQPPDVYNEFRPFNPDPREMEIIFNVSLNNRAIGSALRNGVKRIGSGIRKRLN